MVDFLQFLNENYFFLVPVLWIIGYALKQTPSIPDWSIIWILFAISLFLACFAFGLNIQAITNGIIATGVAVFGQQAVKQTLEAKNKRK
ncbi:phage holin family protein [Bacillus sp. B-jedd]|uniref:phage holin family protein n=1 Tax=Bacillus sp. B-jedd TaxID=1476857 RepID=UPI00051559A8|nr:phage holin family protein [Bacillus sp. B-jedd]CEG26961.1 phage holin [Bacillus sp. B-jedd]